MSQSKIDKILNSCNKSKVPFLFLILQSRVNPSLSIQGLADFVGISRQSVYGWKTGASPSYENLLLASKYVGFPIECLSSPTSFCNHLKRGDDIQKLDAQDIVNLLKIEICTQP